jgi:hypothetical protein
MKTKLILFFTVFLLSASLKSQNAKIKKDYKNALSVDVGSFAMLNYHRRIFRKNWYALNGQVGVGIANPNQSCGDLLFDININAYLNNLFIINKHEFIVGIGEETAFFGNVTELMGKIGYQYNIFRHFSVNFTIYHWIWRYYRCPNDGGPGPLYFAGSYWYWKYHDFRPFFSFGINFNF